MSVNASSHKWTGIEFWVMHVSTERNKNVLSILARDVTAVPGFAGMEFDCGLCKDQACAPLEPGNLWGFARN